MEQWLTDVDTVLEEGAAEECGDDDRLDDVDVLLLEGLKGVFIQLKQLNDTFSKLLSRDQSDSGKTEHGLG